MSKKKYKRLPKPTPWGEEHYPRHPRRKHVLMTPELLQALRDRQVYERIVKEMAERERQKCS